MHVELGRFISSANKESLGVCGFRLVGKLCDLTRFETCLAFVYLVELKSCVIVFLDRE